MVLLKLNFKKAYSMVDLDFLFQIMQNMGVPEEISNMVRILFTDATTTVSVNGGKTFSLEKLPRKADKDALRLPIFFYLSAKLYT